jgi:hypothetical protein
MPIISKNHPAVKRAVWGISFDPLALFALAAVIQPLYY